MFCIAAFQLAKPVSLVILGQDQEIQIVLNGATTAKSAGMVAVAAELLVCGLAAFAASPADTIAARQANFKQMGKGMTAIGEQLKSPAPTALARNAIRTFARAMIEA